MDWRNARATTAIAIVTAICSLLVLLSGFLPVAAVDAGFIPLRYAAVGADEFPLPFWLTPLTATLIHGGLAHLALNLVMFLYCGAFAERAVGVRGIFALYLIGAYAAALGHFLFQPTSQMPMIGASGAISAVVGAYALLYGERRAKRWGPIPADVLHVAWLAVAWIGIQLLIGIAGLGGMGAIAIGAHIGGFLAGLVLARPLLLWRYRGA